MTETWVLRLDEVRRGDVGRVGGKNASLGEMIGALGAAGVKVPPGFATTAAAYRRIIAANGLEAPMRERLAALREGRATLAETGAAIRRMVLDAAIPPEIEQAIRGAYRALGAARGEADPAVAVRSSATAEDLPTASFAGQQETFLNVRGERALLEACRACWASLYTDRAIAYRDMQGFAHEKVALSIGVQLMVRADLGGSGIMFTLDTESGFPGVVLISAAWGLGEPIVQGAVNPDRWLVFKTPLSDPSKRPILERARGAKERKMVYAEGGSARTALVETTRRERDSFVLSDEEVLALARAGLAIERHYGMAMDIEWARDGIANEIFIVQARPETVHSARRAAGLRTWRLTGKPRPPLLTGAAVGDAIAAGPVKVIHSPDDIASFPEGAVLVTEATDPDWVPIMKKAAGIVTDQGGTTSHAAIVSRELGLPAVVGTGAATRTLRDGQQVTLSCAEGPEGRVYDGLLPFSATDLDLSAIPRTRTRMMLNIGSPAAALRWWRLPADGVGLARMEFIVSGVVKAHPMALLHPERVTDPAARREIAALTRGFGSGAHYFVDTLARGVARIAAPFHPKPVILRMSDFKSNEYAHLIGGEAFEPKEENPMLGLRGAARYTSPRYREGFALECAAVKMAREEIGCDNIIVMIPFCRTPKEADAVLAEMARHGLKRGENGLEVYVMCEIPANVILAERFAERFDGFSIGSNDLTQLTLGVDRDSAELRDLFDERDEAVKRLIAEAIRKAHAAGRKVGICGEAPSNHPDFAAFLVECGIDSISLNPDGFAAAARRVAEAEAEAEGA
ncbi:MAG: phosphoenolpyruvate synthase [Acetobacteraceae bacterium]|nr:phosphoenolpyruvate synthase [Acetobacteraceae bacterium]